MLRLTPKAAPPRRNPQRHSSQTTPPEPENLSPRRPCAPKVPRSSSDQIPAAGQECVMGVSRPVGRVLCARLRGPAVIHLGLPLPTASCGLPASIGRATLDRSRRELRSPLDLAPGGVYRAAAVTCGAGGLLHHRFTLTPALPRRRSVFCGTIPRVAPGRRYRPPCPVEPGPSSPGLRPARPPGRLTHSSGYAGGAPPRVPDRARACGRRERFDRCRGRARTVARGKVSSSGWGGSARRMR